MPTKLNIFVSRPTIVDAEFEAAYGGFHQFLESEGFKLRRLGGGDWSRKAPLKAVIEIIAECNGTIVLGYPQIEFLNQVRRSAVVQSSSGYVFPTPWNQIEGALAYQSRNPVLIVAHNGVTGGVFDHGVTGESVLNLDLASPSWFQGDKFRQPFMEWKKDLLKVSVPN